ncbi:Alpha/Beta hydrolase protein [Mycena capillaripes]|nr:Alpha/Beta hydrolase protein [Mycena capillaripes]
MSQNPLFVTSKDGTKIFAETKGDPSNPCIVFAHGLSTGMGCFDRIFADPRWTERAFLVRYNIRGHGLSTVDTEESSRWESLRFAEDFDAVISHFGVARPFFAGWSMGATIPVDILTAHDPTYLAGLILLAPQPYMGYQDVVRPEAVDCLPGLTSSTEVSLFKSSATEFVDSFTSKPMDYSTRFTVMGAILSQPGKAIGLAMSRPQDPNILFGVAARNLPLLLILGEHDKVLYSGKLQEDFERERVDIQTAVLDAGHAMFLDCHDEVRERVLRFIDSQNEFLMSNTH